MKWRHPSALGQICSILSASVIHMSPAFTTGGAVVCAHIFVIQQLRYSASHRTNACAWKEKKEMSVRTKCRYISPEPHTKCFNIFVVRTNSEVHTAPETFMPYLMVILPRFLEGLTSTQLGLPTSPTHVGLQSSQFLELTGIREVLPAFLFSSTD